jgi:hypothetical protein
MLLQLDFSQLDQHFECQEVSKHSEEKQNLKRHESQPVLSRAKE